MEAKSFPHFLPYLLDIHISVSSCLSKEQITNADITPVSAAEAEWCIGNASIVPKFHPPIKKTVRPGIRRRHPNNCGTFECEILPVDFSMVPSLKLCTT